MYTLGANWDLPLRRSARSRDGKMRIWCRCGSLLLENADRRKDEQFLWDERGQGAKSYWARRVQVCALSVAIWRGYFRIRYYRVVGVTDAQTDRTPLVPGSVWYDEWHPSFRSLIQGIRNSTRYCGMCEGVEIGLEWTDRADGLTGREGVAAVVEKMMIRGRNFHHASDGPNWSPEYFQFLWFNGSCNSPFEGWGTNIILMNWDRGHEPTVLMWSNLCTIADLSQSNPNSLWSGFKPPLYSADPKTMMVISCERHYNLLLCTYKF